MTNIIARLRTWLRRRGKPRGFGVFRREDGRYDAALTYGDEREVVAICDGPDDAFWTARRAWGAMPQPTNYRYVEAKPYPFAEQSEWPEGAITHRVTDGAVFDRALTDAEIAAYNGWPEGAGVTPPVPVWEFAEFKPYPNTPEHGAYWDIGSEKSEE